MNNLEKLEELKCYLEDQEIAMLINGDAIEELKKIADESVDLILTDPPYNVNYKTNYRKDKSHRFNDVILNDNNLVIEDVIVDIYIEYLNPILRVLYFGVSRLMMN